MISPDSLFYTVDTLGLLSMLVVVCYHFLAVNGKYMVAQDAEEIRQWEADARAASS